MGYIRQYFRGAMRLIAKYVPSSKLRIVALRLTGQHIGRDCFIGDSLIISERLHIDGRVYIGNRVTIAQRVTLITYSSPYRSSKILPYAPSREGDIIIGDDAWLGVGVSVLPGVKIGTGAIVATHAVVTQDVAPYSIVGGIPARYIRDVEVPESMRSICLCP